MKNIVLITPDDGEYGFGLAGIQQLTSGYSDAANVLEKAMADAENGLVIVDERLVSEGRERGGLTEERLREMEHRWQGILLVLPSPEEPPAEAEDYAARLIRRAIGYHVRLKL